MRLLAFLMCAALGGAVAGCGDDAPRDAAVDRFGPTRPAVAADLDGRRLQATRIDGRELLSSRWLTIADLRLHFGARELAAHAGCNWITGAYDVDDGRLTQHKALSTMMGCQGVVDERWLREWLAAGVDAWIQDDTETVILNADGVTIAFTNGKRRAGAPSIEQR